MKMLVLIMIGVFVINRIMFYGGTMADISFSSILNFFSNLDIGVDFTKAFEKINGWSGSNLPDWLSWLQGIINILKPFVSLVVLIAEVVVTITVLATKLIGFIFSLY